MVFLEAMSQRSPITSTQRDPTLLSRIASVFLGVSVQIARKFLFISPKKKAIGFVVFVIVLSIVAGIASPDHSYYFLQKHSVFNQYGVKLGWMWTCVIVGPFIWISSRAHYRDKDKVLADILRLAIATFCWYVSVWQFNRITEWTSYCNLGIFYSKARCQKEDGVWNPGFDISGHCFLLIYSMLVMSEEASAFREWNQILRRDYDFWHSDTYTARKTNKTCSVFCRCDAHTQSHLDPTVSHFSIVLPHITRQGCWRFSRGFLVVCYLPYSLSSWNSSTANTSSQRFFERKTIVQIR
ncbi:hypothetical protein KIN20_009316 [Parelaphostrongylus tenuis]|uniref:Uncharacterized protein n=1 Tax=Parelaphostrongylus tenuis TaxID=148309 RepID=A0AAD5M995_PARTN|nr:hypothetical protein KIN20_009316 [Parelaphostrongylus tenuis]